MEKKEYFIGLDMGTNSVGWAVTDKQYNILRAKGKDMWGIREFQEAITAADRRTHRVSRRNRQRSQVRIGLLKDYFSEEIGKVDNQFFARLENSFFRTEDKDFSLATSDSLFADKDYKDKDYFKDYPTIFHLKMALINDEVPFDSRYSRKLFLALLNYFKHRGHFLNLSLSGEASGVTNSWELYREMVQSFEEMDIVLPINEEKREEFLKITSNRLMSRSGKRDGLMNLFGLDKKGNGVKTFVLFGAILGLKTDANKLLGLDAEQKTDIDFSDAAFDEKLPELISAIGEDYANLIDVMKKLYDAIVLSEIMEGVGYLSEARVRDYDKHAKDLRILKKVIQKYCGEGEFDYLFRSDDDGTYSAYVGSVNSHKKCRRGGNLHKSSSNNRYDNLRKRIKKDIEKYAGDADVDYIIRELDSETFLPKQLTYKNGVIPNQLHEREIRKILDNAEKKLPFLSNIDDSGLSVKERIIRLFKFNIPYYVGPISQNYKGNGWAIRKAGMETSKVYPWNIEEIIDYKSTNEAFIKRMVRECTYICGEKVLPKESMIYQRFIVLNTINSLRIRGERIPVALKQDIYRDLFESGKKVTKHKIAECLCKARGLINEESELSGIDETIGGQLTSYSRFYPIFKDEIEKDSYKKMIEEIIFWGTVYGDAKEMLKEKICEKYLSKIPEDQIKRILGYKFRDWGNLSEEFLELCGVNTETGEEISIIRALWEDNLNLTELVNSDKYTFGNALNEKRSQKLKTISDFEVDSLNEYYFSAPVKRMIWQTIEIVKEIQKVMGYAPEKIFVEMTRTNEEKKGDAGRKDSREKMLLELYKSIKSDRDWDAEIKAAGDSGKLKSKKLFLYYTQMGRDMYTGESISLDELFDDNKYDVDHIFPRHFVKDDSIHNNLVLVDKRKNSRKSDNYPIDIEIREDRKVRDLWILLREKGLISEEKYRRLTGCQPFSEEQKADFISRQMVETGQATKGVNDLLKELMPETTIVYAKAGNVSDFRHEFGFYKSRLLNDFHHAQDAYLNIVVGNVYFTKFTSNPLNFIKRENAQYHLGQMFDHDVVRNDYAAWIAPKKLNGTLDERGSSMETVRKMMLKNTPLMTRLPLCQHGALFDATIYSAAKAKSSNYIPVKSSDDRLTNVEKYGGYNSAKIAYFFLVEHEIDGKGKEKGKIVKVRTLECLPLLKQKKVESSEDGLYNYCLEMGLRNPSIRMKRIKPQTLLKINGFPSYITGKSVDRYVVRNAVNFVADTRWIRFAHDLEKYLSTKTISENLSDKAATEFYELLCNKHCNSILSKRPNPIGDTLVAGKDKFCKLELEGKLYVLAQILNLTKICDSSAADLTLIGGSAKSGVTMVNKQISSFDSCFIVTKSVTGLYEKEIDLKKI